MTVNHTVQRLLVVLNLPRSVPALLIVARVILERMTDNRALPSPVPTLAVLNQAIDDLQAAQVEAWTTKQWEAAKKKWAKDKKKWSDCQTQSSKQKLEGRKSWSFLYTCMTS